SARPRSTTSAGRTCRQASSAAARPRPPSSRSRRETAPPRCDRPPQSPPHCSTSKYQKPQKLRYDPSRLILLALRLCPANPGNPRNRIEGESPHSGKDIRSSLIRPTFWTKQNPAEAGLCQVNCGRVQLFVRGSVGIGGAIFSAGTFWSIGGIVVRGAAGAGTIGEAGGLTD